MPSTQTAALPRCLAIFMCTHSLQEDSMNIRNAAAPLIACLALTVGIAQAKPITVGLADNTVSVDGKKYELVTTSDKSGLMWEETSPGSGTYKACICSMFAFRALQAVGEYLGLSDLKTEDITIVSGWSTDGPERIFDHSMGWDMGKNFSYTDPLTDPTNLTLADAWLTFTSNGVTYKVSSLAENYAFTDDTSHDGYHAGWDFFKYRTHFQTVSNSDATGAYFKNVIRGQIVDNFTQSAAFEVTPVPEPATLAGMGIGLAALALVGRRRSVSRP